MRSLFGVVHLSDRTMIFWDCILFFAYRAWAEKQEIPHHAFHTASPFCQADPERCNRLRRAWVDRNAETAALEFGNKAAA